MEVQDGVGIAVVDVRGAEGGHMDADEDIVI
jgi:hypothetical protein